MSPEIDDLIKRYRRYRNAFELLQYIHRDLIRGYDDIVATDEVIAWALTTTEQNESGDAAAVAERLRTHLLSSGRMSLHEHPIR